MPDSSRGLVVESRIITSAHFRLALAATAKAVLVTGDNDLLEFARVLPIHTPRGLLALVES